MLSDSEKAARLAERLPVRAWLDIYGVRETEHRLRRIGYSQMQSKRIISEAKARGLK